MDDPRIYRLNETTAVIDVVSASSSDSGLYYCYVVTNTGNMHFVCSMHLEVGRKYSICFSIHLSLDRESHLSDLMT